MTIRYTCSDCQSVLKIKDEKAGTNAKCPKCKTPFVVPQPDDEDGIEVESEAPVKASSLPVEEPLDMVDMPIELTPEVSASDDFDPMDVLGSSAPAAGSSKPANPAAPPARKASMAEMMKDLDASKKKEARKSSPDMPRAMGSAQQTAGSAADMLSRAYQQKRDSASAPPVSQKNAKAAEERALLMEFLRKQALPAIVVIGLFVAGYYWWSNQPVHVGPPLFNATGIVSQGGTPAGGIQVVFEPIHTGPDDIRDYYRGTTDESGKFSLMYTAELAGAAAGDYMVSFSKNDKTVTHPNGPLKLTVSPDGPNEFKIDL